MLPKDLTHNLTETEAGNPALRRARLLGMQTKEAVRRWRASRLRC